MPLHTGNLRLTPRRAANYRELESKRSTLSLTDVLRLPEALQALLVFSSMGGMGRKTEKPVVGLSGYDGHHANGEL